MTCPDCGGRDRHYSARCLVHTPERGYDIPAYRRYHAITPVVPRRELVVAYLECLGLEHVQEWPASNMVVGQDPVTESQFGADLADDLETTRARLEERRAAFERARR